MVVLGTKRPPRLQCARTIERQRQPRLAETIHGLRSNPLPRGYALAPAIRRGRTLKQKAALGVEFLQGIPPHRLVTHRPSRVFQRHTPHPAPSARYQRPRKSAGNAGGSPSANTPPRSVTADRQRTASPCERDSKPYRDPKTTQHGT